MEQVGQWTVFQIQIQRQSSGEIIFHGESGPKVPKYPFIFSEYAMLLYV